MKRCAPVMLSVFLILVMSGRLSLASDSDPVLSVDKEVVDLGELAFGEEAIAAFELTNQTDEPVLIRAMTSSCSCRGLDLDLPISLAPGESIETSAVVRAAAPWGKKAHEIFELYLDTDRVDPLVLNVHYRVRPMVSIASATAGFANDELTVDLLLLSEDADLLADIQAVGCREMTRSQPDPNSLALKVSVESLQNGSYPQQLHFELADEMAVPLVLQLSSAEFELPEEVRFDPLWVTPSPETLRLRNLQQDDSGQKIRVFLPVHGLSAPLKLESSSPRLSFELVDITETARGSVLTLVAAGLGPGRVRASLTISSDRVFAVLDIIAKVISHDSD